MKEIRGDIFAQYDADAICVTTNTECDRYGMAIMGKGLALSFAKRYPTLKAFFGEDIRYRNGKVFIARVPNEDRAIVNFPTKWEWRNPSSLELIKASALALVRLADFHKWEKVVLTRPGCGLGGLKWEDVKRVIEPILDDRFYIITP